MAGDSEPVSPSCHVSLAGTVKLIYGRYLELLNKNPKFNCAICQETLPSAEGPGRTPTRKCKHKVNVCSGCLCDMVTHAVKTGNFEEIKCPAAATDKCKGVLDGKDVEAFVDRETYKEYVLPFAV